MSIWIDELKTFLYVNGSIVVTITAIIAISLIVVLARLLFARGKTEFLDSRAAGSAAVALGILLLLPVPALWAMRPGVSVEVSLGEVAYRQHCVTCHGEKGDRLPGIPLRSAKYLETIGDEPLSKAIKEGIRFMPAFGRAQNGPLTDDQVTLIVAYMKATSYKDGSGSPQVAVPSKQTVTSTDSRGGSAPKTDNAQQELAAKGKSIYMATCSACHGEKGDHFGAANLASKDYLAAKADTLIDTIMNGKGVMLALGQGKGGMLTTIDANAVVAYLNAQVLQPDAATQKGPSGLETGTINSSPDQVNKGKGLYEKNCGACHGPSGDRIPSAKLNSQEFLSQYTDGSLMQTIAAGRGSMPGFGSAKGGPLNDDQVNAVAAYLKSWAK